jgi:hypothetical protein
MEGRTVSLEERASYRSLQRRGRFSSIPQDCCTKHGGQYHQIKSATALHTIYHESHREVVYRLPRLDPYTVCVIYHFLWELNTSL